MTGLHLAVDADSVGRDGSGNETLTRGLIRGLQDILEDTDHLSLFGSRVEAIQQTIMRPDLVEAVRVPAGIVGQLTWARMAAKRGADAALGHWVAPFFFPGTRIVILPDLAWHHTPRAFPWKMRARLECTTRQALFRCPVIMTGSHFSATELRQTYPAATRAKFIVSTYAPDDRFRMSPQATQEAIQSARSCFGLPPRYALAVGNLQPRKNLAMASRAAQQADIPLVVAGHPVWKKQESILGLPNIQWLGYVADSLLPGLYAAASVFVYPSLYEGFGLPIVEAMAAGCPVVCSSTSSMPEVAAGAAILIDPHDQDGMAAAIRDVVEHAERARSLIAAGFERVAPLSWKNVARDLMSAVKEFDASLS